MRIIQNNYERRIKMFQLVSKYEPSGDQPQAIKKLVEGIKEGKKEQFFQFFNF